MRATFQPVEQRHPSSASCIYSHNCRIIVYFSESFLLPLYYYYKELQNIRKLYREGRHTKTEKLSSF